MSGTRITGRQRQRIVGALLSGFPTRDDLEQFVSYAMNESLDWVASGSGLEATIFRLVTRTESRGLLVDLVCKAHAARPGNPDLRSIATEFRCPEIDWPAEHGAPGTGPDVKVSARGASSPAAWRRRALIALAAMLGAGALEYLNRRYLHLLQLYFFMETAGTQWTWITALASFVHVVAPSGRWKYGLALSLCCVGAFFLLDRALVKSTSIKPEEVQWILPLFYGCAFGSLAWSATSMFGTARR